MGLSVISRIGKYLFLSILSIYFPLMAAGCNRQHKTGANIAAVPGVVSGETRMLANIAGSPSVGDGTSGHGAADYIFSALGYGVIYKAEQDGKVKAVHNGVSGKPYQQIHTPALSRDGLRAAYGAEFGGNWRMVVDGREGFIFAEVGTPVFSPDGKHLLYSARIGDKWFLVLDNKISESGCPSYFGYHFSGDSKNVISFENTEVDTDHSRVVISDMQLNALRHLDFSASGVVLGKDLSRFAAIADTNGKKRVIVVSLKEPVLIGEGEKFDSIDRIAFGNDNNSLTYVGERGGKRYIILDGREQDVSGGTPSSLPPVVRPDRQAAGFVLDTGKSNQVQFAFDTSAPRQKQYEEAAFVSFDSSGRSYAYCARNGKKMFFVVNGMESPVFDKVLAPVFSPDGSRVVARVRKDGKRFVVVMDLDARVMSRHPAYDSVYDTTFTADGKSVAYGVRDGNKLIWKVEKLQ